MYELRIMAVIYSIYNKIELKFYIEAWAGSRIYDIAIGKKPQADMSMVEEAQECAKAMRIWHKDNYRKWRK